MFKEQLFKNNLIASRILNLIYLLVYHTNPI